MPRRSYGNKTAEPGVNEQDKPAELKEAEKKVYEELVEKEFDATDQEVMCINEHERFRPSSSKVAHALVYTTDEGTFAKQYNPPVEGVVSGTQIRPVKDLEIIEKVYGSNRGVFIRAKTPNGTEMMGKRKLRIITNDLENGEQAHDLWRMSPTRENLWRGEYFYGVCADQIPLFRTDLPKDKLKELEKEQESLPTVIKHKEWQVDSESVHARALNPKRGKDQNTVMGSSAFDEAEAFYNQHYDPSEPDADELHPERRDIFQKNSEAKQQWRGGSVASQYRHEWLHALGHSLAPSDLDPQTKDNLAAGPKWMNSEMMVNGERAAKWVALHVPGATIDAECKFELIKGSEIIEKGEMRFTFEKDAKKVEVQHHLNPWRKFIALPKPSDNAQTTLVISKLLTDKEADLIEPVSVPKGVNYMPKQATVTANPTQKNVSATTTTATTMQHPPAISPATAQAKLDGAVYTNIKNLRSSIVKVFTRGHIPNYGQPWRSSCFMDWHGSGYVFERNNKLYVLSNAHVVENHLDVRVRLANDHDEYPAKVFTVGYQCDLAILEVEDKRFLSKAKPLPLGEMVTEGQEVAVLGFPTGGLELSFTTGPVSRIQMDEYAQSGEFNLQAQTQAPTNPGNSGGPVISDGKIVGVAFQTNLEAEGVHYFIPTPVMQHFMDDAFNPNGYKGFPDIAMNLQDLTGDPMRAYYGLKDGQTGVRVQKINPLSSAYGILQVDDIITAIDGVPVTHDEKVNVPGIGERLDLNYMFLRKQMGDNVKVSILRKNPQTQELEKKAYRLVLDKRPGQTTKVGPAEFDKSPTYFFNSGVLFQTLTPNYLESIEGLKFRAIRSSDDECINEIPCKQEGDQIVIINSVLKCDSTFGGHEFENMVVKEINGQQINNLNDAILALRKPQNGLHAILVDDGFKLVVRDLTHEQNMQLLTKYRISKFCSDDLQHMFDVDATMANETDESDDETFDPNDVATDDGKPDAAEGDANESVESDGETLHSESEHSDSDTGSDLLDFIDNSVAQPKSAVVASDLGLLVAPRSSMGGFANTVNRLEDVYSKAIVPDHKKRRIVVESSDEEMEEVKVITKHSRKHKM